MPIGKLERIRRYPVKSLTGETLEAARVLDDGLEGDRTTALLVRGEHPRAGKPYRGKEGPMLHTQARPGEAIASASRAGVSVEIAEAARYFDAAPISILVDRWLDGLRAALGYAVEYERFRANLTIRADAAFARSEAELVGTLLRLGDVLLRVRSPIERCVVTTYAPDGSGRDPRVLRWLAQERDAIAGIYCIVERPGTVNVGDDLIEA